MSLFYQKMQKIWLPFVAVTASFVVVFAYIVYFIDNSMVQLPIKDSKTWILAGLMSVIPTYFWIRPRVNLLHYGVKDGAIKYHFVAVFIMTWGSNYFNAYLCQKHGTLTVLKDISQICDRKQSKYYHIEQIVIDKSDAVINKTTWTSGKHGRTRNFGIDLVMPIKKDSFESVGQACNVWCGISFETSMSNSASKKEKDEERMSFETHSLQSQFEAIDFSAVQYLELVDGDTELLNYLETTRKSQKYEEGTQLILKPRFKDFKDRFDNSLNSTFWVLGIGYLFVLFNVSSSEFKSVRSVGSFRSFKSVKSI